MKAQYSTAEVAAKTGATLRMLQWLDSTGVVVPKRGRPDGKAGRRDARRYSADDVAYIAKLQAARTTYRLRLEEAAMLVAMGLPVRVITEPTRIGNLILVPKRRDK